MLDLPSGFIRRQQLEAPTVDIVEWIEANLRPYDCYSDEFIYDDMASQSDGCLPILYQPFDIGERRHWLDRGSLWDFVGSLGTGRLLDFGPGDGWPSLIMAPYVEEVIGVDASRRRVDVCTENAARLSIENARFLQVPAGERLPFEDESFDGIAAASSIEQTPDPEATLKELYRVLRPGGRFRVFYEALGRYRGGREREVWLHEIDADRVRLIVYDRLVSEERVRQYGLTLAMPKVEVCRLIGGSGDNPKVEELTVGVLAQLSARLVDVRRCLTFHPSGETMAKWLRATGFRQVVLSHSGAGVAARLFDLTPCERRPSDLESLDGMLRPVVQAVIELAAPVGIDPMITALK